MASAKKSAELSTNNFILIMIVVSVVAVVLSVLVGRVLVAQILLNNKVIAKKVLADNQLKSNITAVQQLTSEYQQLGGRKRLILDSLPVKPDVPGLVSSLELVAGASGLKLKSVTPVEGSANPAATATTPAADAPVNPTDSASPAAPAAGAPATTVAVATPYSVALNVEGNYVSLIKFLGNLELSARPVRVTSVVVAGTSSAMTAEIQMESYWQPEADLTPKMETVQ